MKKSDMAELKYMMKKEIPKIKNIKERDVILLKFFVGYEEEEIVEITSLSEKEVGEILKGFEKNVLQKIGLALNLKRS